MIWMFAVKNKIKYCVWNKLCLVFNIRCRREKSQKGQQLGSLRQIQPLALFCACTGRFVSDLFENHIVGFSTRRLIYLAND